MKRYLKGRSPLLPVLLAASVMGGCKTADTADDILIDYIPDDILIDEPLLIESGEISEDSQNETEVPEIYEDPRNSGTVLHIAGRTEEFRSAFDSI